MLLTIGMATYDDIEGVWPTIQALRLYQDLDDCEILVVDNEPRPREDLEKFCKDTGTRYIKSPELQGTSAPRQKVFEEAKGDFVICMDCHVLFEKDVIKKFKEYIKANPDCKDLLQGPLYYDDLKQFWTHFDPVWSDCMYGTWGLDPKHVDGEPFDIPMQGLGVFAMRKSAWPGFNRLFRGFGGEEGYIHEKVRQRNARALCLPWFKWVHRFYRSKGVPYPLKNEDRIFNYIIGHQELDLPLSPMINHFKGKVSMETLINVMREASQYNAKEQVIRGSVAIANAERKIKCISLGTITSREDCNCPAKYVYACERHEKCRPYVDLHDGIRSCQKCHDYQPEDPVEQ